jgi:DNA-binding MarR family transcriptional regulator
LIVKHHLEVNVSGPERAALQEQIAAALAELQAAYDDRDRALADSLGVGRTDLRCLDLVVRHGPQTASELGAQLHLTRGSMTTLIDRLVHAGYVERHDDPDHGRRKLIVPTTALVDRIGPVFGAAMKRGRRQIASYTDADLVVILRFLRTTADAQHLVTELSKRS